MVTSSSGSGSGAGGGVGYLVERMRGKSRSSGSQRRREIPLNVRHEVFRNAENRCQQCGKSAADGVKLEVDHIMPVSRGGSDDISNLQLLCFECNRGKSDRVD